MQHKFDMAQPWEQSVAALHAHTAVMAWLCLQFTSTAEQHTTRRMINDLLYVVFDAQKMKHRVPAGGWQGAHDCGRRLG